MNPVQRKNPPTNNIPPDNNLKENNFRSDSIAIFSAFLNNLTNVKNIAMISIKYNVMKNISFANKNSIGRTTHINNKSLNNLDLGIFIFLLFIIESIGSKILSK